MMSPGTAQKIQRLSGNASIFFRATHTFVPFTIKIPQSSIIAMGKKKTKEQGAHKVKGTAVLRDSFVPAKVKAFNLAAVQDRWIFSGPYLNGADDDMDLVIAELAKNFIPQVPCTCCVPFSSDTSVSSRPTHGPQYFSPMPTHKVVPDLTFALRSDAAIQRPYYEADLDETTSIEEYASTFRSALFSEHEELMQLYEKYSLVRWQISRFNEKCAVIHYVGISDARPSLQVSDIVLLRPRIPVAVQTVNHYHGRLVQTHINIEIETRILSIARGYRTQSDHIIIDWNITHEQVQALNDPTWGREYSIRFVPTSSMLNRSLTALNWLENSSTFQRKELEMILFPVSAPVVKPLTREQMRLEISDGDGNQLNELQSSFVRMVRARTLDPSFGSTRPPMILTGPAGTGKTRTLICAIVDVLGLLQPEEQRQANTNRVLICCPSHAASDVLTRRLSRYLKQSEIFRMYDASRHFNTVPDHVLPFTCQAPGSGTFSLPSPLVWKGFRAVICTCVDAHILYRANLTNHCIRSKRDCFKSFLLPPNNALGISFGKLISSEDVFFTHLFVDEASQATEPEMLCPISCVVDTHPGGRKVEIALIG